MIRSDVGCVFSQKKLLMDAVMDAAGVLEEPVYQLQQHALLHCSCRVQRCKLARGLPSVIICTAVVYCLQGGKFCSV
jgi:hypothetical protein